ncbi:MAG: hypothetical protein R3B48_22290 [Kofleriaceae bacterium]
MKELSVPLTLTFAEADERYELSKFLNTWDEDQPVKVYAGDAALPELDLSDGPCLVAGNLEVAGDLLGMDEEDGFLVVLGRCDARNVLLGGPEVWIQGDLVARNGVLADYNHGLLTVGGDLEAAVVCAEHTVKVQGTVRGLSVDFGGLRVAAPGFAPTVTRNDAVYHAREHFVPGALNEQGYANGRSLFDLMQAGEPPLSRMLPDAKTS